MVAKFKSWLEGLVEDDPLPYETNVIMFNVRHNGNYKYLECIGYEQEINPNSVVYYPLEAQCFLCHELAKYDDTKFLFEIQYIIDESFSSKILKQQFKNKKIYLRFKNEIKFLFKV